MERKDEALLFTKRFIIIPPNVPLQFFVVFCAMGPLRFVVIPPECAATVYCFPRNVLLPFVYSYQVTLVTPNCDKF
jgi:hypothetical protein